MPKIFDLASILWFIKIAGIGQKTGINKKQTKLGHKPIVKVATTMQAAMINDEMLARTVKSNFSSNLAATKTIIPWMASQEPLNTPDTKNEPVAK